MIYCFNCGCSTNKPQLQKVKYNFLFSERAYLCPTCRHILEKKIAAGVTLREATKYMQEVRGR